MPTWNQDAGDWNQPGTWLDEVDLPLPVSAGDLFSATGSVPTNAYGTVRFRLIKAHPEIDHDLVDGWISDRYIEILDAIPWKRLTGRTVITTFAGYSTGTVSLTAGTTAIVGGGTAWTSDFDKLGLCIDGRGEYYAFTYQSATAGLLSRPFEGPTGIYTYRLFQSVYKLPANAKILNSISDMERGELGRTDRTGLESFSKSLGVPQMYRHFMCASTGGMQIETYPVPDRAIPLVVDYVAEAPTLTESSTLLPWVRPACLIAGVEEDILEYLEKFAGADRKAKRFAELLSQIKQTAILNIPPQPLRLAQRLQTVSRDADRRSHLNQMP